MYIFNLIEEINIWRKVRNIAKTNEALLNKNGFRVDWVGRIYTVINLPEEVMSQPYSTKGYVLMKLREYDDLFLGIGIADYVFPELMEIPDSGAYLLILSPNRDYIKLLPFLWFLLKLGGLYLLFKIIFNLVNKYENYFVELFNFIKSIF